MVSYRVPPDIRGDLVEAEKCLNSGAYTAAVTMAGRALEGLVRKLTSRSVRLQEGIKELHQSKVIDDRLLDWADKLRLERNEGAHASGRSYNAQDAADLVEFSKAISEYVFDITHRFEKFMARRTKREALAKRKEKAL
jgi:hypothetical protein